LILAGVLPCTLALCTLVACGGGSPVTGPSGPVTATRAAPGTDSSDDGAWVFTGAGAASSTPSSARAAAGPDEVALAATRAWFSWDTRVDRRPNDTARRLALGWLTPTLRGQVVDFRSEASPGADWEDWARRHAHASVIARLGGDDRPPDGADVTYRQVIAVITLQGDKGWKAVQERTVFLRLALDSGRWRVAEITAAAQTS
jgi:hypothetical protein